MDVKSAIRKLFSARILSATGGFAAIAIFTNILGSSSIGSFFLFQVITGIVGIPSDIGVSKATEKALSSNEPMGEVISSSIFLKAFLLVPWIILLYVFGPYINTYIGIESILPYVLIGLVTAQMRNLSIRILAGQMKIGQTAILRVFEKLAWIFSGLALANLDYGGTAIIIGFIIGDITIVSGALIRMDIEFGYVFSPV